MKILKLEKSKEYYLVIPRNEKIIAAMAVVAEFARRSDVS
jgi:hypothetical protein